MEFIKILGALINVILIPYIIWVGVDVKIGENVRFELYPLRRLFKRNK